jgi:restriction system protein
MSGPEFERYMAEVYRALGYNVEMRGGSGDQGVDLLLRKGREFVAVQCKNHQRPVNNTAIQEVYTGQRYYGANQAWVVAPAGFTKGARPLARRTGVRLFDRASIEQ